MNVRKVALMLGTVAAMSWAAPAYATSYGSASSPVRITSNGNGWFYGNVTIYNHESMRNGYYYRDTDSDGNPVYVQTNWYYKWVEAGNTTYEFSGKDQSPRIGTEDGTVHSEDFNHLISESDAMRAETKVCEDQSWSPDPCSNIVKITLGY